jgi:hypothetical protein
VRRPVLRVQGVAELLLTICARQMRLSLS